MTIKNGQILQEKRIKIKCTKYISKKPQGMLGNRKILMIGYFASFLEIQDKLSIENA